MKNLAFLTPYLARAIEQVKAQRTGRCMCGDCTLVEIEVVAWRMHWAGVDAGGSTRDKVMQ